MEVLFIPFPPVTFQAITEAIPPHVLAEKHTDAFKSANNEFDRTISKEWIKREDEYQAKKALGENIVTKQYGEYFQRNEDRIKMK